MTTLRTNSQRARAGNIVFNTYNIGTYNLIELSTIHTLPPNINLGNNEFLGFIVKGINSDGIVFDPYVPILDKFNKSFYPHRFGNSNGYKIGVGHHDLYDMMIGSITLVKLIITHNGGGRPKSTIRYELVEGEWDAEFTFINENNRNHRDDELLIIQHDRDALVNHSNIGLRMVYPVDTDLVITHKYTPNIFHNDREFRLIDYHSYSVGFTISDPNMFLFMTLRRY